MVTQQNAINAYWAAGIDPNSANSVLGNVATNIWQLPGTYIVTAKRYVEMSILFF